MLISTKKIFYGSLSLLFIFFLLSARDVSYADADILPPSTPGGLVATPILPGQVNLSWSASTDNVGVAGYYVYRNGTMVTTIVGTSFSDSGLSPAGYSYAVAAYDAAGNVSAQAGPTSAFLPSDTISPSAPTGVTLSPVASSTASYSGSVQINISWAASTDNIGVVGYSIYRNGALLNPIVTVSGTTYSDTAPAGTYSYVVVAYDASKNYSLQSAPTSTTIVLDTTPPSSPGSLRAGPSFPGSTQVSLSWATSTDNLSVAGYFIYRNGVRVGSSNINSYADSGVSPGDYTYTVTAYDVAGNISSQSSFVNVSVTSDNAPPTNPGNVHLNAGTSSITVSWDKSSDDNGVSGYYVYRNGTQVANVSSTPYQDLALASGTYVYNIAAYDFLGNISGQSFPVSLTFVPSPLNLPSLVAVPVTNTGVVATATPSVPANPGGAITFSTSMYFGLRSDLVKSLQALLVSRGYLLGTNATGFFGSITEQAIKKFQCDYNVVCSGSAGTTGWGFVGAKTRAALNSLAIGISPTSPTPSSTQSSQLNLLQSLQAQLLKLQAQLQAVKK